MIKKKKIWISVAVWKIITTKYSGLQIEEPLEMTVKVQILVKCFFFFYTSKFNNCADKSEEE